MITAGEEVRDAVFAATILPEPPFQFDRQLPFLLEHFLCQTEINRIGLRREERLFCSNKQQRG
jgi:hypothetical protein